MESFNLSFKILTIFGIWKPSNTSKFQSVLYDLYSLVLVPLPYILEFGLIARLFLTRLSFEEFTETLFISLATMGICFKALSFVSRRKQIVELSKMVSSFHTRTEDAKEMEIHQRYQKYIRYISIILIGMVQVTVVVWLSGPFFQPKNHRTLPYKVWLPYNNSPERVFWITYVPVSIAIATVAFVATANDIVFCGLIIIVCGQLKLLTYRLMSLPENVKKALKDQKMTDREVRAYERNLINRSILHHIHIYDLGSAIKSAFSLVISTQFITSSVIISINVYQLSTSKSINMEFLTKLCFLICVLMEFFMYCWFGNELMFQSEEFGNFIYKVDWTSLKLRSTKRLLFVTLRATKPIVMSYGFFIVLSLDSFVKILKISYTAFNILRTSS